MSPRQQPLAVVGQRAGISDPISRLSPTNERKQVVIQLLHQKPLASHRVQATEVAMSAVAPPD